MPITNGHIEYERRVKTGDFEHKAAKAVVHFAVDQGEVFDELMGLAGALATHHVFTALRATPRPADPNVPVDAVPTPAPVVAIPGGVNGADVVPDVGPQVTNLKAAKRAVKKQVVDETPLTITPVPTPEPAVIDVKEIVGPVVIVDDFTAVPTATDAELGQALSRVNTKLKDRDRLLAIIKEFTGGPIGYSLIPAVRRGEFVQRLEALV